MNILSQIFKIGRYAEYYTIKSFRFLKFGVCTPLKLLFPESLFLNEDLYKNFANYSYGKSIYFNHFIKIGLIVFY